MGIARWSAISSRFSDLYSFHTNDNLVFELKSLGFSYLGMNKPQAHPINLLYALPLCAFQMLPHRLIRLLADLHETHNIAKGRALSSRTK